MTQKNGKYLPCCMAKLQHIIAGKWKIYILWILAHQTMRFGELTVPTVLPLYFINFFRNLANIPDPRSVSGFSDGGSIA